jgi:hypothetical protein
MIGGEWLMGWIAQTSMDVVGEMVPLPLTKTHLIIGNGTMLRNSALVQNQEGLKQVDLAENGVWMTRTNRILREIAL